MEIIQHPSVRRATYDQARWDKRYREGHHAALALQPDAWAAMHAPLLKGGRALDVACGRGRHTLWLARLGYEVDAVDISYEGLRGLAKRIEHEGLQERVRLIQADLEVWRPEPATYDLILVVRYLNRSLIPSFKEALRPGGLVLYRTFHTDWARPRSEFQRGFLLQPGEFLHLFRDWEWLAYEERRLPAQGGSSEDCTSAILARKVE
jgi:SAM-dependent methyltransferase